VKRSAVATLGLLALVAVVASAMSSAPGPVVGLLAVGGICLVALLAM
jgi:hypothetical protein